MSGARTASEQVKPSNDRYRHSNHAKERPLVSDKRCIHENRLHHAGPKNQQASEGEIDITVHHCVFRCIRKIGGLLKRSLKKDIESPLG